LLKVEQIGGVACHTGRESCFYKKLVTHSNEVQDWEDVDPVLVDPDTMYPSE